jgi:hypothetical protein
MERIMQRRHFIGAASMGVIAAAANQAQERRGAAAREYYEIRRYRLRIGARRTAANEYLRAALVPALNRAGLRPIGVFDVMLGEGPAPHILIPHKSLESVATVRAKLQEDAEYRKAGAAFLDTPSTAPAYDRIESWLLLAFEQMPVMEVPDTSKPRIFEWRRYESHSDKACAKKIEMFNDAGEIALFKRLGFRPVFFGETIAGTHMPNLEYAVTFDSLAHREDRWNAFRVDPEWKKMSGMPEYSDAEIMSGITSAIWTPNRASQI